MGFKYDSFSYLKSSGNGYIEIKPKFQEDFQEIKALIEQLWCFSHIESNKEENIIYAYFTKQYDDLEVLETVKLLLNSHMRHFEALVTNNQLLERISFYPECRKLLIEALEAIDEQKDIITGLDKIRKIIEYLWQITLNKQHKSLENITKEEFVRGLNAKKLNKFLCALYPEAIASFMRFEDDLIKHNIILKNITDKDIHVCKNLGLFLIDCIL